MRRVPFAKALPVVLFVAAALWSLHKSRAIFFQLPPTQAGRAVYDVDAFPEAVQIGRYLREHCPPGARIAVIGSEPEIYFYSQRRAATGYLYTYPLMEPQPFAAAMQLEMMREIERANPDYVVFVKVSMSWEQRRTSNLGIFDWFTQYQREHLQVVGLIQILSLDQTDYNWDASAATAKLKSDFWLAVYKKKSLP
jgi:hypothetical protein